MTETFNILKKQGFEICNKIIHYHKAYVIVLFKENGQKRK